MALLGVHEVIQNGRQHGRHLFGEMRKFQIFLARVVKCDIIKHIAAFGSVLYFFPPKKGEKYVLFLKWFDFMLLLSSEG